MSKTWMAALVGLTLAAAGCVPANEAFVCTTHGQCLAEDGRQGMCEATGFCSFSDPSCADSLRRYGEAASAELSGACVGKAPGGGCVTQISAGGDAAEAGSPARSHTCARKVDGSVWCWGANHHGQLGDGTQAQRAEPARVEGLPPIARVSAGIEHTCALADDGRVFCWGANEDGQLGVLQGGAKIEDSSTPVEVTGLPAPATSLAADGKHTCAVLAGGALYCWGRTPTASSATGPPRSGPPPSSSPCRTS